MDNPWLKCVHCGGPNLPLAPLTEDEAEAYPILGWTMRRCVDCDFYQNHWRGDHGTNRETLDPFDAAEQAPRIDSETGLIVVRPKLHSTAAPSTATLEERTRKIAASEIEVVDSLHGSLL